MILSCLNLHFLLPVNLLANIFIFNIYLLMFIFSCTSKHQPEICLTFHAIFFDTGTKNNQEKEILMCTSLSETKSFSRIPNKQTKKNPKQNEDICNWPHFSHPHLTSNIIQYKPSRYVRPTPYPPAIPFPPLPMQLHPPLPPLQHNIIQYNII